MPEEESKEMQIDPSKDSCHQYYQMIYPDAGAS